MDIDIIQHPEGGESIQSLKSVFSVQRNFEDNSTILQSSGSPRDITIYVEWYWQNYSQTTTEIVSRKTSVVNEDSSTLESDFSARPGYVLLNYYHLKISWTDDDGYKEVLSRKAFGTYTDDNIKFQEEQNLQSIEYMGTELNSF